tara:strand:- start:798 stop:1091 length:294 start_codon:yes stop_codon:yes gene_type:complete
MSDEYQSEFMHMLVNQSINNPQAMELWEMIEKISKCTEEQKKGFAKHIRESGLFAECEIEALDIMISDPKMISIMNGIINRAWSKKRDADIKEIIND